MQSYRTLRTNICGVAGNRVFVSIEYLNKQDNEVVEIDLPDPSKNPEETWQTREIEDILREEVSKLGMICRRAIEICVLDESPQLEAAQEMNLSVATMKSRVFRGKRISAAHSRGGSLRGMEG